VRSIIIFLLLSTYALADTIRIDLPLLESTYSYGQKINIPSLALYTQFRSVSYMQLELTGIQQMGFWQGDMVEDMSSGPRGGSLYAEMNTPSNPISPALGDILRSSYTATEDGDFTSVLSFKRLGGGSPKWSLGTNLSLSNEGMAGWGRFTTTPIYTLTNVTLLVTGIQYPNHPRRF
jgi:hypothetical protein